MPYKTALLNKAAKPSSKQLSYALEIKSITADGTFDGYASVFGVVDNQQDVVEPGAFRATLKSRKQPVQLLWQHQWESPIGMITSLFEDQHGLFIKGKLLMDVERAREAYALMKAHVLRGLSIGYRVVKAARDPITGVRKLLEVDLREVSLVTFPSNEEAQVMVVKSAETEFAQFLQAIDRAGMGLLN